MSDLISRKAAIEAVCRMMHDCFGSGDEEMDAIAVTLNELQSAQPEKVDTPTVDTPNCEDAVSRQAVKEWLAKWEGYIDADIIARMQYRIIDIPPAQPEMNLDEWCTDCKEYDHERNCCPRWNRVIRQTLKDAQLEQWIPCSERLPDEYGNYLISIKGEEPDIGTINPNDPRGWSLCDANGFYWANDKMLNIIAWMPLPEPYAERRQDG